MIIFMAYTTKITCRIKIKHKKFISSEQKILIVLTFFLWLFNDPLYVIVVFFPSLNTYAVS